MRSPAVLAAISALSIGCALDAGRDESRRDRAGSRPSAVVLVETSVDAGGATSSRSTAVFGSTTASDLGVAATWVGASPVVPPKGTCERPRSARLDRVRGELELVPVRTVSVGDEPLVARAFPDLGNGLGGVVYTSRDRDHGPAMLRVDFDDGVAATFPIDAPRPATHAVAIARDGELVVAWTSDDEVDLEYVDVLTRGEVLRCAPASGASVRAPGAIDSVVSVHRLRRGGDPARGVELLVDAAREVKVEG